MSGNFTGGIIGASIGAIVGLGGSIKNIRDTQKAMKKAYIRQMKTLVQNYNYNQNALDQESRFNLESAKQNLFNITFNGIQNNSAVFVAQAETGYEGRTGQQIARAITGQVERRRTGVIENYQQQDYQIRREKDNLYIQTQNTVEQAEENFNNMQSSSTENVFNALSTAAKAGYQGFMIGSGIGGGFGGGEGGSSGFSWDRAMQSFNQVYSKYGSIQNMFSQFGALGQSLGSLFGSTRDKRYNFIY